MFSASGGCSFWDRGAGFAGAPTSLPAGLCFFRGLVVLSGFLCQVPTLNPPGTYEISAHLLPNPALHTEEGVGPEIQVVISDPSSSHVRGQAQAAESLKPRKPQKPRIREIDETAAFQNRTPLNTNKAADPNTRPERCQSDPPPSASKATSITLQKNMFSSASGGCSFGVRGVGFAGAPTSLPAGLCFSWVGGPVWVPVQSPNSEPPQVPMRFPRISFPTRRFTLKREQVRKSKW